MQLWHILGLGWFLWSTRLCTKVDVQSPSGIPPPVKNAQLEVPEAASIATVENWKNWFTTAAQRASRAGFDVVELHAAHGYGLNQWLSPLTNHRSDAYGGSAENRRRILCEIVARIRAKVPDILISVRMPGKDFLPGGLELEETIELAKSLVSAGASMINVSSGLGGWRNPTERSAEGYLVPEAEAIQKEIEAPVIGVGGIQTIAYIEESLRKKRFTLAAVGRAILHKKWSWI